jgi:hypothetical protein
LRRTLSIRPAFVAIAVLAPAAALAGLILLPASAGAQAEIPLTRAERTGFEETTRYDEVIEILRRAADADSRMHYTTFGYTMEGRALPLLVVGDVRDASPEAVHQSGKLRVYLQGNIHGGEVPGKEALLILVRELATGAHAGWADDLVLLVGPIYNADGNEAIRLTNRPRQHGPIGGMGTRPNAQGYDLNRDHMKLDSPEGRSVTRFMTAYDPHVSVDLHTTNGTRHAYHLTYSPPLHPATPAAIDAFLRDEWLPAVTERIRARDGWEFYHYGNVMGAPDGDDRAWVTFDHRPRFGTNYGGVRNRFSILSEAYAYLTLEERVRATYRFVEEVLDFAAARSERIAAIVAAEDARPLVGERIPVRAAPLASTEPVEILMGEVAEERHPLTGAVLLRRLDVVRPERMREFIAFEGTAYARVPAAYLLPPELADVADRLDAHGVRTRTLETERRVDAEAFMIDSTSVAEQEFQGRNERTVWGSWTAGQRTLPAGTIVVPMDQPLARLAVLLLEPRADDGFLNWALLDDFLTGEYPILRSDGMP